ncbi:hypothetical protein SNE40_022059 [Patella caerulea]|uniref:Uncharacterized protein n=1 Tax=Patella caerulea TaxID=87958 RepID=A0AAN8G5N0_PATCE
MDQTRRKNYERKLKRLGFYEEVMGTSPSTQGNSKLTSKQTKPPQNITKNPGKHSQNGITPVNKMPAQGSKDRQSSIPTKIRASSLERATQPKQSSKSFDDHYHGRLPQHFKEDYRQRRYPNDSDGDQKIYREDYRNKNRHGNDGGYYRPGRQRYGSNSGYEESDESNIHSPSPNSQDLSRERIETELRSSRIAETKVRKIAARLTQHKIEEENHTPRNQQNIEQRLKKIIANHLDPLLYGTKGHTDLAPYDGDLEELVKKVYSMIKQIQGDVEACHNSLKTGDDDNDGDARRTKSIPRVIQRELQELQTDYDILYDKYKVMHRESKNNHVSKKESLDKAVTIQQQNIHLEKEMKRIKDEWTVMAEDYTQTKANEKDLKERVKVSEEEKSKFDKRLHRLKEVNNVLTEECNRVTDENTRLNQEMDQMEKDLRKLSEPDKKMLQKIQRLEKEAVDLKTANRRLENEKGLIRGSLIKLESTYDMVQKDKRELTKERNKFWKENQTLRTENHKLTLSR